MMTEEKLREIEVAVRGRLVLEQDEFCVDVLNLVTELRRSRCCALTPEFMEEIRRLRADLSRIQAEHGKCHGARLRIEAAIADWLP